MPNAFRNLGKRRILVFPTGYRLTVTRQWHQMTKRCKAPVAFSQDYRNDRCLPRRMALHRQTNLLIPLLIQKVSTYEQQNNVCSVNFFLNRTNLFNTWFEGAIVPAVDNSLLL